MDDYVLYAVEPGSFSEIKHPEFVITCELWKELPPLKFEKKKTHGGHDALCADSAEGYVWIPPSSAAPLAPSRILRALGSRSGRRMHFFWIEPQAEGADYMTMLADAKAFNVQQIALTKERERQQAEARRRRKEKKECSA